MRSDALKYTKDVLIKYLKAYMRNYDNYKHYCPVDFSEVDIYDKEPNKLVKYPTVIITGSNGQVISSGLHDLAYELYDDEGNFFGHRFGGQYEFNIQIDVGTKSTLDREMFTDLVTMAFRVHLKRYMQQSGIFIRDMKYGGESEVLYDSDKIYVSSIQFTTWSEWYQDVEALSSEGITVDFDMNTD